MSAAGRKPAQQLAWNLCPVKPTDRLWTQQSTMRRDIGANATQTSRQYTIQVSTKLNLFTIGKENVDDLPS